MTPLQRFSIPFQTETEAIQKLQQQNSIQNVNFSSDHHGHKHDGNFFWTKYNQSNKKSQSQWTENTSGKEQKKKAISFSQLLALFWN